MDVDQQTHAHTAGITAGVLLACAFVIAVGVILAASGGVDESGGSTMALIIAVVVPIGSGLALIWHGRYRRLGIGLITGTPLGLFILFVIANAMIES